MTQPRHHGAAANGTPREEENRGLLFDADNADGYDDDDLVVHSGKASPQNGRPQNVRTTSRVRFDLTPEVVGGSTGSDDGSSRYAQSQFDVEEPDSPRGETHRVPLLTDMEAPSVAVANAWDGDEADVDVEAEMRRPKSGMRSAFMNMANSIIGAGIIGQPYAMRQAGLIAGSLLLVGLTVVVDWTICLIVVNSKLSGTSSFQGTVEHCFGRTGLIAISVAQWVFAFGGMVAFGVIVGDTIPHVLSAVWPELSSVPVIGLLTNRQVAIAVFVMGVSFPLTLYRDIAKVCSTVCGV